MSKFSIQTGMCPRCENMIEINRWDSINVSLDPDMKNKVLDRSAFFVECPSCGLRFTINYGFLYHDMEKKYMLHYVQSEEEELDVIRIYNSADEENAVMRESALMQGYLFRIVRSYNELIEKISIFDAGLDDRVMEIYKVLIELSGNDDQYDPEETRMLYDRPKGIDSILVVERNRLKATIPISMEMYGSLKDRYAGILSDDVKENLLINREWIETHMK